MRQIELHTEEKKHGEEKTGRANREKETRKEDKERKFYKITVE